ncbi:hypothetical protein [Phaeobacter sp. 22II1-1F12B]|uniref:hypothetical protein n=1 Tax=Phaeobacter sp. 22II1-1F12B TaxID=1317111 RepID=UPI000B520860|nr:hypothetical protein [Phaeobacter sp. 22II1-1F12B]OWU80422.1 hypothetical protein ATO1_08705 [Phaeobacter sp. 22II1-1F12B]
MNALFSGLSLRMVLYLVFAMIAGQGIAVFDPEAGTLTFHLKDLETLLVGLGGYIATFAGGRVAKAKGGTT